MHGTALAHQALSYPPTTHPNVETQQVTRDGKELVQGDSSAEGGSLCSLEVARGMVVRSSLGGEVLRHRRYTRHPKTLAPSQLVHDLIAHTLSAARRPLIWQQREESLLGAMCANPELLAELDYLGLAQAAEVQARLAPEIQKVLWLVCRCHRVLRGAYPEKAAQTSPEAMPGSTAKLLAELERATQQAGLQEAAASLLSALREEVRLEQGAHDLCTLLCALQSCLQPVSAPATPQTIDTLSSLDPGVLLASTLPGEAQSALPQWPRMACTSAVQPDPQDLFALYEDEVSLVAASGGARMAAVLAVLSTAGRAFLEAAAGWEEDKACAESAQACVAWGVALHALLGFVHSDRRASGLHRNTAAVQTLLSTRQRFGALTSTMTASVQVLACMHGHLLQPGTPDFRESDLPMERVSRQGMVLLRVRTCPLPTCLSDEAEAVLRGAPALLSALQLHCMASAVLHGAPTLAASEALLAAAEASPAILHTLAGQRAQASPLMVAALLRLDHDLRALLASALPVAVLVAALALLGGEQRAFGDHTPTIIACLSEHGLTCPHTLAPASTTACTARALLPLRAWLKAPVPLLSECATANGNRSAPVTLPLQALCGEAGAALRVLLTLTAAVLAAPTPGMAREAAQQVRIASELPANAGVSRTLLAALLQHCSVLQRALSTHTQCT